MKTYKLVDISLRISSGLTPLRSNVAFWENGLIPWLKTEQLGDTKYIYNTNEHISEIALKETSLKLLPENTLSIAMYGEGKTRGNLSIIKTPMTTNQACCNVEIDPEKADFEYVYYFLKTQYEDLRNLSSGVRKNLNSNDIKNYPIHLPSLKKQHKIAQVLSTLDRKIALNQQINTELEKMAKALYDYWFVQFDFPDENGNPYKSSGGEMVYNPELKREVPKGWVCRKLGELCELKNGVNYDKDETGETSARIINVRDISNSSIFILNASLDLIQLEQSKIEKYLVDKNTILITRSGNPGATRLVFESENVIYCGFIIGCKPYKKDYKFTIFYSLKNIEELIQNKSAGTILKNISQDLLKDLRVTFPKENDELLVSFNKAISNYFELIKKNITETQHLTQLRDFLLPMLMNGQVEVDSLDFASN